MNTTTFRKMLENPKHPFLMWTLALAFVVVFTWPTVDSYLEARQKRFLVERDIAQSEDCKSRIADAETRIRDRETSLAKVNDGFVTAKNVDQYREEIVAAVKRWNLTLRKVRVSPPTVQPFGPLDNTRLNQVSNSKKEKPTTLRVEAIRTSVQVSGNAESILEFLSSLSHLRGISKATEIKIKHRIEGSDLIDLEMELEAYNLISPEEKSPGA